MRRGILILGALVVLAAVGCGAGSGSGHGVDVVATTTELGDIVRAVGGDDVDVHQLLQANSDPHEYEPRPDDVVATAKADVAFLSGNGLDDWMDKVISQSGGHPDVVVLSETAVDHVAGERGGPEASTYDPHWWHDPRNVEAAIPAIRDALIAADPAHRRAFTRNAAAYGARVRALDRVLARCFARVPAAERTLVTSHDAFNYFARRYGITVVGAVIPSQTTEAQPSAGALGRLADLVRREHVRAIFPERSVSPRLAEALARETGATARLKLYGDSLGPAGSPGATYLGMERANADAMLQGFTGSTRDCAVPGP